MKAYRAKDGDGAPHPADIHVGNRIRLRRNLLGLTQIALGTSVGLTFQQIQKYERGGNRVSASRLYDFSRVLDVPIGFFFDGIVEEGLAKATGDRTPSVEAMLGTRETADLLRAYYRISDPQVRRCVYDLAKALAGPAAEPDKS